MSRASGGTRQSAFSRWMRTGGQSPSWDPDRVERKFNPWHDPADGRFTFAGTGRAGGAAPRLAGRGAAPKARVATKPSAAAPRPASEFAGGVGEGLFGVAKGTVAAAHAALTTNPVNTIRAAGRGIAGMVDTALAAEDVPARVQLSRAADAVANASARDVGRATGAIVGNVALTVAPGAALGKVAALRRVGEVVPRVNYDPPQIGWVKENLGRDSPAKHYNDTATGARPGQAPTLMRTMPDGSKRPVKFDGIQGEYVIDRKFTIVKRPRARAQLMRQSEVLAQNRLVGTWEVPDETQRIAALKLLRNMNVRNIKVRIVKP